MRRRSGSVLRVLSSSPRSADSHVRPDQRKPRPCMQGDLTYVTAQDPKHPEYGQITLFFSSDPIALRQWIVTDGTGSQTRVTFEKLTLGKKYPLSFFSIDALLRKSNDR